MSGTMQWFRLYSSIVDDEKLRLLAFEDRWHFVAICALKCNGLLDEPESDLKTRRIAVKLGVQVRELDEVKRRLLEVGLIDEAMHPVAWNKRQYRRPDLPDGENLDGYKGYVYFIADAKLRHVKIGFSKNPWARVKEFQTGRPEKLAVVATVKTTEISEASVHDLFAAERMAGEWFAHSRKLSAVINAIKAKKLKTADDVAYYVANYVEATITTTETETETETDKLEAKASSPSSDDGALKPEHFAEAWNDLADRIAKPKIRNLTPERRMKLKARIAGYALDDFREVLGNIEASPFLRGDKGWSGCTFDWVTKKGNFQKILEGNYNG